ncbi:hypothetical protein C799_00137 [Bacteroides thetaiotaomicron dnLKV9]|uniref:Uncharacterized protein n=2 Tax=Bacteroides thetaiotaomicron TaxID=818 RepID=A0A174WQE4_BACT4|nr:hypothetical protein C799_00137 [Bacteroides thetaiotaomicron dnLKV9]CUQ46250.1 Uncharacterised protein [Bacteroides thetaiotaomicron]
MISVNFMSLELGRCYLIFSLETISCLGDIYI